MSPLTIEQVMSTDPEETFTEATTGYWQALLPKLPDATAPRPPFRFGYPVALPDGRILVLPLRRLPHGHAVASLIANQASLPVVDALADGMTTLARSAAPDVVVGLPTLGLAFAPLVAARLGFSRFVPLGYSRKFWYRDDLSEPVRSITSPEPGKRIYLDPNQLPLLQRQRVVVVDDAVSSGTTILAVMRLLRRAGVDVARIVVAMKQTDRWRAPLAALDPGLPERVHGLFGCPMFERRADGWYPGRPGACI